MRRDIKERIEKIKKGEVPEGYKNSRVGVIPIEWVTEFFKDICKINSKSLKNSTDDDYLFKYYDLSCADNGRIYHPCDFVSFKEAPSRARRIFKKNDILMSTVRPYLKGFVLANFYCEDCVASTGFAILESKKKNDVYFTYQNLFSDNIEKQINSLLVGSNYPAINSTDVENLKIPYPPVSIEREKIGEILSTWDRAIELKEHLIEQKKEQKRGLMKKLLTGEVRLPGFKGKWKKVRLGTIGSFLKGKGISKSEVIDKGIPCIRYGEIYTTHDNFIKEFKSYISRNVSLTSERIYKGDILFAGSGETQEEIGKSVAYINDDVISRAS